MVRFSVIIPNYNHAPLLKERIESVLNQTYPHYEIILLDDHSADNSREIIESYRQDSRIRHIDYAAQNSGSPFGQWQKGIQLARYEWVWIAESDDVALPGYLAAAAAAINGHEKEAIAYYCNSVVEGGETQTTTAAINNSQFNTDTWSRDFVSKAAMELNNHFKYRPVILNASAAVIRKDVFAKITTPLHRFRYYGDWFVHVSMMEEGVIIYDHRELNRFRRTEKSHSQLMNNHHRLMLKEECFRILLALQKNRQVTDKKELRRWFTRAYTGFGFRSDGFGFVVRLVVRYYSINFSLATSVLFNSMLQKLGRKGKK